MWHKPFIIGKRHICHSLYVQLWYWRGNSNLRRRWTEINIVTVTKLLQRTYTQKHFLNRLWGKNIFDSHLVHLVSLLLFGSMCIRMHLHSRRSPQLCTIFVTRQILDSAILPYTAYFYHGCMRTVYKIGVLEVFPPLALKPMIIPFGRRINRSISVLHQKLQSFLISP